MSRGRNKFYAARSILLLAARLMRIFPTVVVRSMWDWFKGCPGSLGLGIRYVLAKRLAASVGDNVYLGEQLTVRGWDKIRIGSNVSLHCGCYLDGAGGITIGDEVSVAHATSILSFEHTWSDPSKSIRDNDLEFKPVVIERDVWVGCGVRILAGVHLGSRTVVAAGAVVNRSHPGGYILAGVPAKAVRSIANECAT
jgi:acetyltransferase-like isoleucine patch superfamily enzyme